MMTKFTIKTRLIISFALLVFMLGGLGIYSISAVRAVNAQSTTINEDWLPGMDTAHIMNTIISDYRILEMEHITADEMAGMQETERMMQEAKAGFEKQLSKYETAVSEGQEKELLSNVKEQWKQYIDTSSKMIEMSRQLKRAEALDFMQGESRQVFDQFTDNLLELVTYNQDNAELADNTADAIYSRTIAILVAVIVIAILLAAGLALLIIASITRPIAQLSHAAERLAVGDVNVAVETSSQDEIGDLMRSFGKMIESIREQAVMVERIADGDLTVQAQIRSEEDLLSKKLQQLVHRNNEILSNINSAADQVASGAKQVSESSIALSQGASEQASSVEELTASLEQVSAQTRLNANNANEANQLAEAAKNNAMQGNDQMLDMLHSMQEINDASSSISKIIKVIDEIAFQTNILALNAAVEAARAGQHGKGFAVVAEEVRNLAARSANAAKETTAMIEGSVLKVQQGTKIADRTADALKSIVNDIEKVAVLVNDISMASTEQAAAITQINQGVVQVSQVIQTNSATSEESAAASEELSSQANMLKQQVSRFKLLRSSSNYSYGHEELNPAVVKYLERMKESSQDEPAGAIKLSDVHFGKY